MPDLADGVVARDHTRRLLAGLAPRPGTTDRPGADLVYADLGCAGVTFGVREWFAGGSAAP